MDGHPVLKNCKWRGQIYSETRYAVIKWLEIELPKITGDILNVAAGEWPVPKQLLTNPGLGKYVTFDKKVYGDSKNNVDVYGDVHNMPKNWSGMWDCVICNQSLQSFKNPFVVVNEMHRILKKGGVLILDVNFNYRFFGEGTFPGEKPKKHRVFDYWRFTRDGLELLTENFSSVDIKASGPNVWDPYTYMVKAIK